MQSNILPLSTENYYTPAADRLYMSCSQFQTFTGVADDVPCEARAMAKILGKFAEEERDAFLLGNYFHSFMESEESHKKFCEDNFDKIYKTKETKARGFEIVGKYAPYNQIDECLSTVSKDASFKKLIDAPGKNEEILTGEIFGVPWRIRCDKVIHEQHIIVDWKTAASLTQMHYSPEKRDRVTFVEHFGYLFRAAIYMEIYQQNFGVKPVFILACVTKQDPPDKGIYVIHPKTDEQILAYEMDKVKNKLPFVLQVKERHTAPKRCGHCDYCRATKGTVVPQPWYTLDPRNQTEWEYDDFVPWNIDPDTGEVLEDA